MKVKAVFFDLDDTLLHDDRTISDYTIRVLRKAAASGIHVIPASGRARHSMAAFVEQIGCASMFVSCNGAELWSPQHQLISRAAMDVQTAKEVARFAAERGCYAQTYADEYFYYSMRGEWAAAYAESSMLKGVYVGDLEAYITQPTSKILLMEDPARVAQYLAEGRDQFAGRLSVSCSKPFFLEFNPLEATKGQAMLRCSKLLGFDPEEAVAFGDSLNDMSMLETAGLGVAVANARDDVKRRVKAVCLSNEQDGVAHYIEDHILKEERA